MKIKFESGTFDTDAFETANDFFNWLETLEGQEKMVSVDRKSVLDLKGFELFDEVLPTEIALLNLCYALRKERRRLEDQLFPLSVQKSYSYLAMQKQDKNYKLPDVDSYEFETLNKVKLFLSQASVYLEMKLHSRLGYNLHILVNNDGKIYTLCDLRELHKSPI
jgi:hypothetical protein